MRIDKLAHTDAIAFDELNTRAYDAEFDAEFPANGSFQKISRKQGSGATREFWYYYGYAPNEAGTKVRFTKYAGPVDDAEVSKRVEAFGAIKDDYKVRRRIVAQLKQIAMPTPSPIEGDVLQALAQAGLFRVSGLVVGSVAYQAYSGLLGVRLPREAMRTQDVDFAQDHGISINLDDATPDLAEVLKKVDPTFRPIPHISDRVRSSAFENRDRFKVEFLTTNRGSDEISDGLTSLPALAGMGAVPLRYLDFLLRDPVRSVMLHDAGVSVRVPAPQRYAIHKIIVGATRGTPGLVKADKDLQQASSLILAHDLTRRGLSIAEAWIEAWDRGPQWRDALARGALRLETDALVALHANVTAVSSAHGFTPDEPPLQSLRSLIATTAAGKQPRG